ncbi:MAG TPA: indolepyruvate ferredoxin oxidoreductase family protein, partial [Alphaproteobacteria bacterium]|nr:indolepyruvate ferredoxin oxidoreductase family protein [Alphaproteobacteria bacterium]
GCHYMATWIRPEYTGPFTQMGGEGAPWIGQAPFTTEKHIFANLGDGTYFHSGLLAIRAAVAAKINITYKILYNDAVAMTGGQHVDGELSVPMIIDQVAAEGVKKIRIVTDQPEKYAPVHLRDGITVSHRADLDKIQKELRDTEGCTILIYDQTCAAEKRRRRKRGLMEDPAKRVIINERVCEGCGDCGVQSNCVSIAPVETEFGRKRQIDQSTCNKDYSCVKGFCPSFVTITGGDLKKPSAASVDDAIEAFFKDMPEPDLGDLSEPASILVTGIGGTGVVTIGAILAMAAHIDGKGVTTMDQTGLAQKGGAVTSHIRIARKTDDIHTVRIGTAGASAIIGCDLLVTADGDCLSKIRPMGADLGATKVFLNTEKLQTGEFTKNPNWDIPVLAIIERLKGLTGADNLRTLDASAIATALMGNSIATNMFMLGFAYQMGSVPVAEAAIMQAIELNGAAVKMNQKAFVWGRRAAWNIEKTTEIALPKKADDIATAHRTVSQSLDELIARRVQSLTAYQSAAYAGKYEKFVSMARDADIRTHGKAGDVTEAVAKYLYKLMAYKDEYEVARLYTDGAFLAQVKNTFEGDIKLTFNLAPPLLARRDSETGHLKKMEFGPWMLKAFGMLAKFKSLRGTPLDIFGYTAERKMERRMIAEYKKMLEELLPQLNAANYAAMVDLARLPEQIRGYGHVKEGNVEKAEAEKQKLLEAFKNPPAQQKQAA